MGLFDSELTRRAAVEQSVWCQSPGEEVELFRWEEDLAFGWEGTEEAVLRRIGHRTLLCLVHRLTYRYVLVCSRISSGRPRRYIPDPTLAERTSSILMAIVLGEGAMRATALSRTGALCTSPYMRWLVYSYCSSY